MYRIFPDVSRHTIVLIGVCVLTFFVGLGSPAITDSDEGFYAESAREMVESGDWLTPHFNYVYRFEKPVLYYWLAASAYVVAGVSEAAARFPSALAGLGLVLLTSAVARRWYDPDTALLAGLITATSFGYVTMARQALPDLTLAFFITLSTWAALIAWLDSPPTAEEGAPDSDTRVGWVVLAGIGAAGAMLTKGPVGLVLPALVVGPLVVWEWCIGHSRRLRATHLVIAGTVLLVLAAPWYLAMTAEHGVAYLDRFFIGENMDRFATTRYNAHRPVWYYLPIVFGGLLPWSPLMLLWWPAIRRALSGRDGGLRTALTGVRLTWWAVAPLLLYTLSVGKQPRYVLPILPPLAILLARVIGQCIATGDGMRIFKIGTSLSALAMLLVAGLVFRAQPLLVEWHPAWIVGVAVAIGCCGVAILFSQRRPKWMPSTLVATSIVVTLCAHYVVLASPGVSPVERLGALLADARTPGEAYSRYGVFHRNLIFYAKTSFRDLPIDLAARDFLASPERVFLVLPADEVPRLEALGATLVPWSDVRYLNTGGLTLRMLVNPDPEVYLRRVVLASNK